MLTLAVDLAAKYSAACLMDEHYKIIAEFDSWQTSEQLFLNKIVTCWYDNEPDALVVEDLPHGLNYSTLIKSVCRLQGRLIERMSRICDCTKPQCEGEVEEVIFLAPAEWRRQYKGLERGTGPTAVVPVAAELGYTPPDLSLRALKEKGGKAIARKVQTDYCSAYLIARWAIDTHKTHGTLDVVGTSRWNTNAIRKKDLE